MAVKLPAVMPLPNRIDAQSGSAPWTPGANVTNIAMPRLVLTMTMLRWSLKSTFPSDWMPTTATVANSASAAPAEYRVRDPGHDRRRLRQYPEDDHDPAGCGDHPAALDLGEPDQADVLGEAGVRERVHHAADGGRQAVGAQRLRMSSFLIRLPTISPVAYTLPVVSTAVISMTTSIEMIAAMENFGQPK